MRSFANLLTNLLLLASVAWSFPDIFEGLMKRDTATTATASVTGSSATDSTSASNSGSTATATTGSGTTGSGTTGTITGTASKTTSGSSSSSSSSISVDSEWPAGGASMTYPASTSTTYYKIGNNITMGWNFTSVEITPSAVNVIATCSSNSATYTLASNVSYANATSVVWNTDNYGADSQSPLLTAHYTLIIYEAGTAVSAVASPGQLGPASYTFGMYIPQSYTPLNEFVCVTCSAAISDMERQAWGFMLTMVVITITSFTIFARGSGLFI